ncbi:cysteine protease XCP1-like [Salvia splendens]|uniref:cysteine protease XCP1-like n=1 Tax=Salvia splendens TaxID=180675 RepID=UPI001C254F94|nr:cysteine protease XCP1-like [Salvia splendens]
MTQHGFSYENEKVKQTRFQIFKDNVQHIERHNQEGNHTYKLGINKFADLTNEEFLAKYARSCMPSFKVRLSNQSTYEYKDMKDVPPSLDWRDHNAVTAVGDQGSCGRLIQLSEKRILDCNYYHEDCNGGRMDHAVEFVRKNGGLSSDIDYPYTGNQGACANNKPSSLSSVITGFSCIPNYNEAALLAAVANQPVSESVELI